MSNLRGVVIEKGAVGPSAQQEDGISGLLLNAPAIGASEGILGVSLAELYTLEKVKDAEDLGITADYDTTNDVRAYRHITEFYRMAGEGTKLFIMFADPTKDLATMITDHAETMVAAAKGEIRYLGVAYNPPVRYAPTYIDGLEQIVRDAIPVAQELHDWSFETDRPLNVFIEGRGINGLAAAMLNLRDIQVTGVTVEYNNVSLVIGQDWNYAETLNGEAQKFADLGTFMGTKAGIAVNENPGDVENLDITDTKKQSWLVAGLSNHVKIESAEADLQTYNDNGYIFGIAYTGIAGYRWNDDHVCAPVVIDAEDNMNVHSIALGATLNKLARLIRLYLLPKVKQSVQVDTATGKLPTGLVKYFEGIGNQAINDMLTAAEISGGQTKVDPNSDLFSGDKELVTDFAFVPTGTIGQIKATTHIKKTI